MINENLLKIKDEALKAIKEITNVDDLNFKVVKGCT